jgi:hypothetical protein
VLSRKVQVSTNMIFIGRTTRNTLIRKPGSGLLELPDQFEGGGVRGVALQEALQHRKPFSSTPGGEMYLREREIGVLVRTGLTQE